MNTETKYKVCRRLGSGVFEKCQTQKFALSEAKKSNNTRKTRKKQTSDFGAQLLEKQKVRFSYGLKEKQMLKYVKQAMSQKVVSAADNLFENLETRLDNVVFRLGLAGTRAKARQIVSHGHITINGKKLNIPSYKVVAKDVIGIRSQSLENGLFSEFEEKIKSSNIPVWLSFDLKKKEGKIVGSPKVGSEGMFNFRSVFEFYSR